MLPPFKLLFESLKTRTQPFSGILLEDGLNAVAWCCKHDLIQQGFTLLEELLFSFLVQKVGGDIKDTRLRLIASQSFSIVGKKKIENPSEWDKPAGKDQQTTRKMIDIILTRGELSNKFQRIRDLRNDLNHAGNKDNSKPVSKANSFSIELKTLLTDMERILLHEEPVNKCAKDSLPKANLFLLFNHRLTPTQEADSINALDIKAFISPPDEISRLWRQIPPELTRLADYLKPVQFWLENQSKPGDFVLVQGDFGACHWIVQVAFALGLVPIYATTRRERRLKTIFRTAPSN
jgi:hypothetical protein